MINEKEFEKINTIIENFLPYLEKYRKTKKKPDDAYLIVDEETENFRLDPKVEMGNYLRSLDNEKLKLILAVTYFGSEEVDDFELTLKEAEKYSIGDNIMLVEKLEKKTGILYPALLAGRNRLEEIVFPGRKKEASNPAEEPEL